MPSRSIRFRLTAAYTAILAITFAIIGAGVWLALRHSIQKTADEELHLRLQSMRGYVEMQLRGAGGVAHLTRELTEDVGTGGLYIRIADLQGKWLYRSPAAARWKFALTDRNTISNAGNSMTLNSDGEDFRILSARLAIGTLQIGLPLHEFNEMLRDFTWSIGLAAPLLLALASLGGYWMSDRALKPVDRIAAAASRITAANLSERLPFRENGDELDRLSATLNGTLARLDQAFTRITQFTADASHELRTPIAIMRTAAELIRSRPRSAEELDKAWSVIVTQTERTSQLIDDLLTLARADSGTSGLIFERTELAPVITEACSEMAMVAKAAGIQLSVCADQGCERECEVFGDPEALRRVFLILLDNAIKFTSAGGSVSVGLRRGPVAEVQVTDSGIGISAEDLPFIFDRFYRAAKDRSRKTGGAGLGLSIAQWIVGIHRGEISAQSTAGAGSTFVVRLPLV